MERKLRNEKKRKYFVQDERKEDSTQKESNAQILFNQRNFQIQKKRKFFLKNSEEVYEDERLIQR